MPRSSPKSHHGCLQCKRRKVKCDEAISACGNCVRRGESCCYPKATESPGGPLEGPRPACVVMRLNRRSIRSPCDIELTHFFLVETLPSIISSPARQDIWQRSIFPESFSCPDILDAHLATAALHKSATLTRADRISDYLQLAAEKQAGVLSAIVPMLSAPSRDTARSLFALSSLITIWTFASDPLPRLPCFSHFQLTSRSPSSDRSLGIRSVSPHPVLDLIPAIKIARGIQAVLHRCRPWLREQGLASILKNVHAPARACPEAARTALDDLLLDIRRRVPVSPPELETYAAAIQGTKHYLARIAGDSEKQAVLTWPVGLSQGFVDALSRREPPALIILAFWAATLHDTPRIRWWAHRWGKDIVEDIVTLLDGGWEAHMEWPISTVGGAQRKAIGMIADPISFRGGELLGILSDPWE